jgi:hypothetical protein
VVSMVAILVFLLAHGQHLTTSPGCSNPTQGGC